MWVVLWDEHSRVIVYVYLILFSVYVISETAIQRHVIGTFVYHVDKLMNFDC